MNNFLRALFLIFSVILLILVGVVFFIGNRKSSNDEKALRNALNVTLSCESKSDLVKRLGNFSDIKNRSQLEKLSKEASWYSIFESAIPTNIGEDIKFLIYIKSDYVYCYAINKEERVVGLSLRRN